MLGLRIRNALIAIAGLALPLFLLCATSAYLAADDRPHTARATADDEPASSMKTPNPSRVPIHFMSPAELSVYVNPRLAGTLASLAHLWEAAYLAFVAAAIALRPRSLMHRPARLFAVALAFGALLSSPWWLILASRA